MNIEEEFAEFVIIQPTHNLSRLKRVAGEKSSCHLVVVLLLYFTFTFIIPFQILSITEKENNDTGDLAKNS